MREFPHHGQINLASTLVSRNRQCAQRGSVIALLTAQNSVASRLADFDLILPRQLQGRLDRFRSTAGEIHAAAAKVLSRKLQQFLRILLSHWSCKLAAVHELELRSLFGHGSRNFCNPMPDKIDRRRTGKIEIPFALCIPNVYALAAYG